MLFLCPHPSVAEVQRSVCGKGRCIHTRLTLKMLSQFLPDYHNNIIIIIVIIIIICIIIILINSFQRSVKNKFSLILLPCDAMRWPFRVICMPLCRARALWLLLLLLWCWCCCCGAVAGGCCCCSLSRLGHVHEVCEVSDSLTYAQCVHFAFAFVPPPLTSYFTLSSPSL